MNSIKSGLLVSALDSGNETLIGGCPECIIGCKWIGDGALKVPYVAIMCGATRWKYERI